MINVSLIFPLFADRAKESIFTTDTQKKKNVMTGTTDYEQCTRRQILPRKLASHLCLDVVLVDGGIAHLRNLCLCNSDQTGRALRRRRAKQSELADWHDRIVVLFGYSFHFQQFIDYSIDLRRRVF